MRARYSNNTGACFCLQHHSLLPPAQGFEQPIDPELPCLLQTILTPLWQVAVAVMGAIMMILILRRPPKAKEVPELSAKAV
jgi:hypothetical protein